GVGINLIHSHAIFGLVKTVGDPIVANLKAERIFHPAAEPLAENGVACVETRHPASVLLFELIAVDRVGQIVSGVGKQIEIVMKSISGNLRSGMLVPAMPFTLQTVASGITAIGRIQRAEETDQGDGVLGDLITRIPFAVVAAKRDTEPFRLCALIVG